MRPPGGYVKPIGDTFSNFSACPGRAVVLRPVCQLMPSPWWPLVARGGPWWPVVARGPWPVVVARGPWWWPVARGGGTDGDTGGTDGRNFRDLESVRA
jgi:hypothetical protein